VGPRSGHCAFTPSGSRATPRDNWTMLHVGGNFVKRVGAAYVHEGQCVAAGRQHRLPGQYARHVASRECRHTTAAPTSHRHSQRQPQRSDSNTDSHKRGASTATCDDVFRRDTTCHDVPRRITKYYDVL
jgi:hypothetical protein